MKKLSKILGVVLSLALIISSVLISGCVPNTLEASSGMTAQKWVKCDTPATDTFIVSEDGSRIGNVKKLVYNCDKTAIYAIATVLVKKSGQKKCLKDNFIF